MAEKLPSLVLSWRFSISLIGFYAIGQFVTLFRVQYIKPAACRKESATTKVIKGCVCSGTALTWQSFEEKSRSSKLLYVAF